jgi:hypothetical protein
MVAARLGGLLQQGGKRPFEKPVAEDAVGVVKNTGDKITGATRL